MSTRGNIYQRKIVLKEGVRGTKVYILRDGSVSVHTAGSQICRINTVGTIFGEISTLLKAEHSATVIAEADTTFQVIEDLQKLLDENPKIGIIIARILAVRVINMNLLYAELKHELGTMPTLNEGLQGSNRLYDLLSEMDEFWGKNVFDPLVKRQIDPINSNQPVKNRRREILPISS